MDLNYLGELHGTNIPVANAFVLGVTHFNRQALSLGSEILRPRYQRTGTQACKYST